MPEPSSFGGDAQTVVASACVSQAAEWRRRGAPRIDYGRLDVISVRQECVHTVLVCLLGMRGVSATRSSSPRPFVQVSKVNWPFSPAAAMERVRTGHRLGGLPRRDVPAIVGYLVVLGALLADRGGRCVVVGLTPSSGC
jgi:hypothetical protein